MRFDVVLDDDGRDGWFGARPPGMQSVQWPRSRNTGLPMVHVMTLRLPPEYQRRGPEYPAISLFQAHDVFANEIEGVADLLEGRKKLSKAQRGDEFYVELARAAANKHPQERVWTEDDIGFALVWLTEAEFAGEVTELPSEVRHEDSDEDEEPCAWDAEGDQKRFRLEAIADPNSGMAPTSDHRTGYVDYFSLPEDVQKRLGYGKTHLGGTVTPPGNLDVPDGMTPYVLEFNEEGGANLAGGGLLLDLETEKLVWAGG